MYSYSESHTLNKQKKKHTPTISSAQCYNLRIMSGHFFILSSFLSLISLFFYFQRLSFARFKAGTRMQTAQINTVKTHLAMSLNDFFCTPLSILYSVPPLCLLLRDDLTQMTSGFDSHILVCNKMDTSNTFLSDYTFVCTDVSAALRRVHLPAVIHRPCIL